MDGNTDEVVDRIILDGLRHMAINSVTDLLCIGQKTKEGGGGILVIDELSKNNN